MYDCWLRARGEGIAWLLFADYDEFLFMRGKRARGLLDAVLAEAGGGAAAVSLGSWAYNASVCDAAQSDAVEAYREEALSAARRAESGAAALAEGFALAELVAREVFRAVS
uniref:Glycosyltransferase family 92 protein n=2 Tax=Phaeomonas parva TaxID=124430 RepID=A0A6U4I384_9STRA|mmetsp:Transcript_38732/g.121398  ORF Transcript_38732/g.121398 Transcript_38732/m.121398 type:complete len:111 (+) Transcript_38732:369-701(+)